MCGYKKKKKKVYHIDKMHKQNGKLIGREREREQKINPNDNIYIYLPRAMETATVFLPQHNSVNSVSTLYGF